MSGRGGARDRRYSDAPTRRFRSSQFPIGLFLNDIVVSGRTVVGVGDSGWDEPTGSDGVVWIGTVVP